MNKSWSKYYENTKLLKPSKFLIEAISSFCPKPGLAIDLGCGAGRDTKYLLEKGFDVIAVDSDSAARGYLNLLPNQNRLKFISTSFEKFHFDQYDLVNAHYALPFTSKDHFDSVISGVVNSIKPGGLFVGQLFGINDEWNTPEAKMTFCSRTDVDKLFNNFSNLKVEEINEKGVTANGDSKHWHVYNIIAQK